MNELFYTEYGDFMKVEHTLKPIYHKDSKVLILGSIPSVKSRQEKFYYAHPQNRFWKTLSTIYEEKIPQTIDEKLSFLNKHHIALFDVIQSCTINGSSDSSIKDIIPNDLTPILMNSQIKAIFTTGKKAYSLYQKYIFPKTKINVIYLPSPSPAHCRKGIDQFLIQEYQKIKYYTNEIKK